MKRGYATEKPVRDIRDNLFKSGAVYRKVYEKKRKQNLAAQKKDRYKSMDEDIYRLTLYGATQGEMAIYFNVDRSFIGKRQKLLVSEKRLDPEQFREYRKQRRIIWQQTRTGAESELNGDCYRIPPIRKFFELAKTEVKLGNQLSDDDITLLSRMILVDEDIFAIEGNFRLLVMEYVRIGDISRLKSFLNKINLSYGDTKYGDKIREYSDFATRKITTARIVKKDGTEHGM